MRIPDRIVNYILWKASSDYFTLRRLKKTVKLAHQTEFYREKLSKAGVRSISSIEDFITKIPLTQREEISLEAISPYDLLAVDSSKEMVLFGQTSGATSGHSVPVFMTKKEFKKAIKMAMRLPVFKHISSRDRVCLLFPMVRTFAGQTAAAMVEHAGALLASMGTRTNINPPEQVGKTILKLKPTILGVVATDALALAQIFKDWGINPKSIGVKKLVIGAELCSKNRMKRMQEIYGAEMIFNFVGQNEVGLPGIPCIKGNTHFPSIAMFVELWSIDGKHKVGFGQQAVPVITPLFKKAMPVLRYWTKDIVIMEEGKNCPCGLQLPLYNILGREGTEIRAKNDNALMPIEIEDILYKTAIDGVWYQIEIDEDTVAITVEHRVKKEWKILESEIAGNFMGVFDQKIQVECVPVGTLYDYTVIRPGKPISRIVDHRKTESVPILEGA
ncbi:MAG: phenylacetate--CoA ligase family protein [Promethearchaeota archaeon]